LSFDLRHLDLVELTERGERQKREDLKSSFGRWLRVAKTMRQIRATSTKPPPRAPIILVAIDLRPGLDELRQALLEAAVSVLANITGARLACLNVMQTSLIAIDDNVDAAGDNIHVQRIAELRRWAEPLQLPRAKITYHLVESRSIAAGIIDFARSNHVDHLVIGAPSGSPAFTSRLIAQITTEAPCTVTVVRATGSAGRVARARPTVMDK
jgi:eukaryotic-like serine/threonine-protein kinase